MRIISTILRLSEMLFFNSLNLRVLIDSYAFRLTTINIEVFSTA